MANKSKGRISKDCATGEEIVHPYSDTTSTARGGILQTPAVHPKIVFNAASNAYIINHDDSYIVLGSDRPSDFASGYGAKGLLSDTIDLVVGRVASSNGGDGPCTGQLVENSFASDAARIYISKLTDVDTNFGIQTDTPLKKRSAIGIKADGVRVIGRSGVKIITGGDPAVKGFGNKGETDSTGEKLEVAPPIEFIAGNSTENLQPLMLGDNTVAALQELSDVVEQLMSQVYAMSMIQMSWMSSMAAVTAPMTFGASAALGTAFTPIQTNFIVNPAFQSRLNLNVWQYNYLHPRGDQYVCSKNVRTT
jgi:hypothetical protein